jgi:hypothetical protein
MTIVEGRVTGGTHGSGTLSTAIRSAIFRKCVENERLPGRRYHGPEWQCVDANIVSLAARTRVLVRTSQMRQGIVLPVSCKTRQIEWASDLAKIARLTGLCRELNQEPKEGRVREHRPVRLSDYSARKVVGVAFLASLKYPS